MMQSEDVAPDTEATPLDLLRPHWRLVLAAFLGWFLDAFDQVALLLVLPEIGKDFKVTLTAMGLVVTAQSLGRIAGNIGWGWLADRYGRKITFMAGVVWFAACSGLTALAWTYGALLAIQFLFGIGFGGEWTASASLLMETVPARARALASSLMMTGYEVGFFAAAGMQALLLPHFGWRALFIVGVAPALLAIFIRQGVGESPVWLRMQREKAEARAEVSRSDAPPATRFRWNAAAIQACVFMLVLQFQTASIYSFYPTLLKTEHGFGPDAVFAAIAAYAIGSILGKIACGFIALNAGHRATILGCLTISVLSAVPFAAAAALPLAMPTAFVIGASSSGVFALVPHFLSLRFADAVRSFGMGLAYALASFGHGVAGYVVPDAGSRIGLAHAIEVFTIASSLLVAVIVLRTPAVLPGRDAESASAV